MRFLSRSPKPPHYLVSYFGGSSSSFCKMERIQSLECCRTRLCGTTRSIPTPNVCIVTPLKQPHMLRIRGHLLAFVGVSRSAAD